jgi:hypothetical protein
MKFHGESYLKYKDTTGRYLLHFLKRLSKQMIEE